VSLTDVVDPPDFEEIIQQQLAHEQDRCMPCVDFPADDISVVLVPKERRTIAPVVPEHG